jgi:glycosyltransferase involved in cell wall biosynthesis
MKLLIVHPCKRLYGGAEEVVVRFCDYLTKKKIDFSAVLHDAPWEMLRALDTVEYVNTLDYGIFWFETQMHSRVDCVICFNFPSTLAIAPRRILAVWYCNEPPELFTTTIRKPIEAFNRWWVKESGIATIVATEADAQRFEDLYSLTPLVVPYGVDYDFWSQALAKPVVRDSTIRLLQVGTVSPYKNQGFSLEVLRHALDTQGLDATLTLVGSTPDTEYLKDLQRYIAAWSLGGRVTFLGQKTREEVRELYATHHVLLHPVKGQGGWLVPFEATCTNLSVVVTPGFQMADYFHNVWAQAEEVSRSIEYLAHKTGLHDPLLHYIRDELTWDRFGDRMLKVIARRIKGV